MYVNCRIRSLSYFPDINIWATKIFKFKYIVDPVRLKYRYFPILDSSVPIIQDLILKQYIVSFLTAKKKLTEEDEDEPKAKKKK